MAHSIWTHTFLIILISLPSSLCAEDYRGTVITDPSIARRCEILTENRNQKVINKQKIQSLIERNKHLQRITPENKATLKKKLETNLGHLEHELILTDKQIQFQEENIIRKGCPGITL